MSLSGGEEREEEISDRVPFPVEYFRKELQRKSSQRNWISSSSSSLTIISSMSLRQSGSQAARPGHQAVSLSDTDGEFNSCR